MLKALWADLGHFLGPEFSKNDTQNGPTCGPDFGTTHLQKMPPKMDTKMVPKHLIGEILASSRPSWALLGYQQAFFESSGSIKIASSLCRSLLGRFLVSFKAVLRFHFRSFSTQFRASLGPLGHLLGLLKPSLALLQALHQLSSA